MKKFVLAGAVVALLGGAASAADLAVKGPYAPPAPVWSWSGIYWGANVGYSWGHSKFDATLTAVGTISHSDRLDGITGGVQSGYNYQFGVWVLGLETDIQASGQKGSSAATLPRTTVTTDHHLDWFGTSRARLGFLATPSILLYGTAGAAYGAVDDSAIINVVGVGTATPSFKDVKAGWTAGAGLEGAFGGGWSAKLEYLYMDLGKTEATFATPGLGVVASVSRQTIDNIVRIGLNWKYGGFAGPVMAAY
jgi:outer membrane immunogenic protein